ncbi:hypothetical protein PCANC_11964 [Puccinia coronata f. sp. avenae]|uniref:Uncharacterized protein n=1 Tax=Puccinia coronata f. sp. avenae TaxID=200324 RepID=A0A2N5T392_9BASI|nr:hypothetical protein PCANC_11964 [Puccinia coronata f. sp. avenae]
MAIALPRQSLQHDPLVLQALHPSGANMPAPCNSSTPETSVTFATANSACGLRYPPEASWLGVERGLW